MHRVFTEPVYLDSLYRLTSNFTDGLAFSTMFPTGQCVAARIGLTPKILVMPELSRDVLDCTH